MRRRQTRAVVEPPARLRAYDPAEWLPLVDPAGYDPDEYRGRREGQPVGPPGMSVGAWRRQEAQRLWSRERLAWHAAHGWPGKDTVDLLRETIAMRRGQENEDE